MEQTCQDAGQSLVEVVRELLREIEKPQSRECPACTLVLKTKQPEPIQQLIRATKTVLLLFECQRDTAPASPATVALIEQADARDPDLIGESDCPPALVILAKQCRLVIESAEAAGVVVDDGNVVDLCADNLSAPLSYLRSALVVAGLSSRFPRATGMRP